MHVREEQERCENNALRNVTRCGILDLRARKLFLRFAFGVEEEGVLIILRATGAFDDENLRRYESLGLRKRKKLNRKWLSMSTFCSTLTLKIMVHSEKPFSDILKDKIILNFVFKSNS